MQLANTRHRDRYIFAGFINNAAPFDAAGNYSGDNGDIAIAVGPNETVVINSPGDEVFKGAGGGVDLFAILSGLQTALSTDNVAGIDTAINDLDSALDQVQNHRADLGGRARRLSSTQAAVFDFKADMTRILSSEEDADMAKVLADMALQQNSLEVIRTSAGLLIGQSLLNFLR